MLEHPPISIDIYNERQYCEWWIATSRTESHRITIVNSQKNYQSVLPSGDTTILQNQPKPKNPNKPSNKEDIPKSNDVAEGFEAEIKQAKIHNQKDITYDNWSTKEDESSSRGNKTDHNKKIKIKHTRRRITQMITHPKKRMSQVQVTKKYSDEKSRHKHRKPVKVPYHSH